MRFKLRAPYEPAGDQPKAIEELVARIKEGERFSVLMGATGTGKSVAPHTPILCLRDGKAQLIPICEFKGGLVLSVGPDMKPLWREATLSSHPAPSPMFRVHLDGAPPLEVTGDHSLLVLRGRSLVAVPTHEVRPGDHLPAAREIELDVVPPRYLALHRGLSPNSRVWVSPGEVPLAEYDGDWEGVTLRGQAGREIPALVPLDSQVAYLLGALSRASFIHDRYINLSVRDPDVVAALNEVLSRLDLPPLVPRDGFAQISSRVLSEALRGLLGRGARDRRPPPEFWSFSRELLLGYLSGLMDLGGTVTKSSISVVVGSREMAEAVAWALLRLGVGFWMGRLRSGSYRIRVSGRDARKLAGLLAPIGRELRERLSRFEPSSTWKDEVPVPPDVLRGERLAKGLTLAGLAQRAGLSLAMVVKLERGSVRLTRETYERLLPFLTNLESYGNLRWLRVVKVEEFEPTYDRVYDLTVPGAESFLVGAAGPFVHNTFTIANVIARLNRPTLIISHNKTLAAQLYGELKGFFPENAVEYFISYYDYYQPEAYIPETDTYIPKDADINEDIERLRLRAVASVLSRRDVVVVASVSCIYALGSPEDVRREFLTLRVGEEYDRDQLLRRLVSMQYTRTTGSLRRGYFRLRGEVLDIIPAYEENLWRFEFFGDELVRITVRNPLTMEVLSTPPALMIYPATHWLVPKDRLERAIESILEELEQREKELLAQGKLLEAQRLRQRTLYDVEMLREVGYCHGVENYSRHLSGRLPGQRPTCLLDYFPPDFLTIVDESHITVPQLMAMYQGDRSRKLTLVEHGWRLPSALDNRPLKFSEIEELWGQVIFMSATPGPYELEKTGGEVVEQIIRPTGVPDPEVVVRPTQGMVEDMLREIDQRVEAGQRVLITTLTKRSAEELSDYLLGMGIKAAYLHSELDAIERMRVLRDLRLGKIDVLVGVNLLREGLDLPEVSLVIITDADRTGFLRSGTSLIQMIGRAARNLAGTVILYADEITPAMQEAIQETRRRRKLQLEYNRKHGIKPRSVKKSVEDIMRTTVVAEARVLTEAEGTKAAKAKVREVLRSMGPLEAVEELERLMREAAELLDFEAAAVYRDAIKEVMERKGHPRTA